MTVTTLSLLAAGTSILLVLSLAASRRPAVARTMANTQRPASPRRGVLDRLTIRTCQLLRVPALEPAARRRLRRLAGLTSVLFWIAPPVALLVPAAWWLWQRYDALQVRRRFERSVVESLPDAVDLLLLATTAGQSLPIAHPLVAARLAEPVAGALLAAAVEAAQGRARADALADALAPLGSRARALAAALGDHLRYGVPLAPTLERMSAELRLDRRRLAEQHARRVPVRLLGPLVLCILPAVALLTVIPLLAAALQSLPT